MEQTLESKLFNFGYAIGLMKSGKAISRMGWNGNGLFIFMQIPTEINSEIIPKMQSLPESVKSIFACRTNEDLSIKPIKYSNQIAIVDTNNNISGWNPSVSDSLAEDWYEVN